MLTRAEIEAIRADAMAGHDTYIEHMDIAWLCDMALRDALRQTQEPVAWMRPAIFAGYEPVTTADAGIAEDWHREGHVVTPLYATAPSVEQAGMVRVPREPTKAMIEACNTILQPYGAKLVWKRMLLAAHPHADETQKEP